jgi:transposase
MNDFLQPQNLLAVGVDTAAKSHHAVLMRFPEVILQDGEIENTPVGFKALDERVQQLAAEHGLTPLYGLEGSGFYGRALADFLLHRGRDVREVQALKVNRQKAYYGQDKSDQIDARAAAAIALRSAQELPRVVRRDQTTEAIRKTSRFLDQLVREKTRHINQLHAALLETYQALAKTLFEDLGLRAALAFYQAYPRPHDLAGTSTRKLANAIAKNARGKWGHGKGSKAWQTAETILAQTKPLIAEPPPPGAELHAEVIRGLCAQILAAKDLVRKLKHRLEKDLLPQTGLKLETLTGIDTRAAGVIIGETISADRFHSNDAFARYNGTAPAKNSTGGKNKHRARHDCNHRLKRIFYLIALSQSGHDPMGKAYYEACIARGLSKTQALKRLGRRISDIVYAMMRDKSEYNPLTARVSMSRGDAKAANQNGEAAHAGAIPQGTLPREKSLTSPTVNFITGEIKCQENFKEQKKLLT